MCPRESVSLMLTVSGRRFPLINLLLYLDCGQHPVRLMPDLFGSIVSHDCRRMT